jgi:probable F420-dependent oxidoreductase
MKLAVEFPSVAFREGSRAVQQMARAIEEIGFDELAVFDHVVMGYPTDSRSAPIYPPQMPVLEALMTLAFAAAVTEHISLSTEVLVLPQRQPVLVAKQVSTLDTLSDGRVRLGVGVGWQESEYDALEESYNNRGRRMDEAIELLRAYWGESQVDFAGEHYTSTAMAMEPKPPQGAKLPIWVGGTSRAALRRVGRLGDGWMGSARSNDEFVKKAMGEIRRHAEEAGRDPDQIGWQLMLAPPPSDAAGKTFYQDHDRVIRRAEEVRDLGVDWTGVNATAIFQAGARSVSAMIDELAKLHGRLREAVG